MKTNKNKAAETQTPAAPAPAPAPAPVTLAQLTPEQIAQLAKQLREARKADRGDHEGWVKIVDAMLKEREGDGFKHTTADILAECQRKSTVKMTLTNDERAAQIKRIQTRKQLLEKKDEFKGKVGYKPSANSFGPLDAAKIVAWLEVPGNMETVTVKQADAMMLVLKQIV